MVLQLLLAAVGLAVGCAGCGWRAGGCAPCALLCWLCGLWAVAPLLAVACGGRCWLCLWPGGCAPGGRCCAAVRLEAVRLCCDLLAACLLAVRFTRRPCPCWPSGCALWPGGRAPGGLCCRRAGGGPPSWPPLLPSAGPLEGRPPCAVLLAGRLSAGLLKLAAVTVRATKNAGKMPRKFPAIFPARYFTRTV